MNLNVWPQKPLSDTLELNESGLWGEEGDSTDYPVLRSSNIHEGRLVLADLAYRRVREDLADRYELLDGDILVTKSSGSPQLIGKACLFANPDGRRYLFSNFTQRLRANRQILDPAFLFLYLQSPTAKSYLQKISNTTSGLRNLNMRDYGRQPVPLPPLSIQKRISAVLDKADAAREKRRQANQLTEQFLQSAFLELFGDPLTNVKGWGKKPLGEMSEKFSDGPFGSNLKTEHYTSSGVRVVRLQNIGIGQFVDEDRAYVSETHFESISKHRCIPGDVLVGTLGDPNLRACILPSFIPIALNKADCIQMRPKKDVCTPEYACWLLNQPSTLAMAFGMIHGQTRARINMGRLRELVVPCPPLGEQAKFSILLEKVESLRAKQKESEKELENLFNSLMQRAFKGELVQ